MKNIQVVLIKIASDWLDIKQQDHHHDLSEPFQHNSSQMDRFHLTLNKFPVCATFQKDIEYQWLSIKKS